MKARLDIVLRKYNAHSRIITVMNANDKYISMLVDRLVDVDFLNDIKTTLGADTVCVTYIAATMAAKGVVVIAEKN